MPHRVRCWGKLAVCTIALPHPLRTLFESLALIGPGACGLQNLVLVVIDAVLSRHRNFRHPRLGAEILAVNKKSLAAAHKTQGELGDRSIWHGCETCAEPTIDAADIADQVDVDLTMKRGHYVG